MCAALDRRLTLICAPAGYGKSTLLTQLHGDLAAQRRQVAWLSLDSADADPVRFASHCLAALQACGDPGFPAAQPDPVKAGAHHGPGSGLSASRINVLIREAFEQLTRETHLFIDDLHWVSNTPALEILQGLLDAGMPLLHLVVATRERPPWPLARLRTAGQLHEVGAADLAYVPDELDRAVRLNSPVALSRTQLDRLQAKTEGWPAGVQLLSLALSHDDDADEFIRRFSGADATIADFLFEEVIQQQAADVRHFLLGTCMLRRFSAEMANDVLQISDARRLIDRIANQNLFLFSLDREGEWYRYHPLFRDLLRKHLHEVEPERVQALHARAGDWLALNGQQSEAIEHALAIGNMELAGQWLDAASPMLFASGHTVTLQRHAQRIPVAVLNSLPHLQLELVWEDIINWRFAKASATLAHLAATAADAPATPPEDRRAIAARMAHRQLMMLVFTDQLSRFMTDVDAWGACHGGVDRFMDASLETAVMMARRERFDFALLHGEWPSLRRRFLEAGADYGTVFLDTVAGGALEMRGELALAEATFTRARETAAAVQGWDSSLCAMATLPLAATVYERDRLAEAAALLRDCSDPEEGFGLVDAVIARVITQARLARAQGNTTEAHRALDRGEHVAERQRLPRLRACVFAERARLLQDEPEARELRRLVSHASEATHAFDATHERLATVAIRGLIEDGEHVQALHLTKQWLSWLAPRGAVHAAIGMNLLASKAHLRSGDRSAAQRSLLDALKRAAAGGYLRAVIDEGPELLSLVAEATPLLRTAGLIDSSYLDALAAHAHPSGPLNNATEAAPAAFGEREVDILRMAATNFSNEEIALALGVSASTVKWYWQRIFEKTGVRRRSQAVRLARGQGHIA